MSTPERVFISTTNKGIRYVNLDHVVIIEADPDDDTNPHPTSLAVIRTTDGSLVTTDMTVEELVKKIITASTAGD